MTAAIFDTDAIRLRLRQLRGEAPTGSFYRQGKDGKLECLTSGHDWNDWLADKCMRCGYTYMDLEDNIAPKVCPGKIDGEACIECGKNAVVTIMDNKHWASVRCLQCGNGSTVSKRPPTPVPAGFKRVGPVRQIGGYGMGIGVAGIKAITRPESSKALNDLLRALLDAAHIASNPAHILAGGAPEPDPSRTVEAHHAELRANGEGHLIVGETAEAVSARLTARCGPPDARGCWHRPVDMTEAEWGSVFFGVDPETEEREKLGAASTTAWSATNRARVDAGSACPKPLEMAEASTTDPVLGFWHALRLLRYQHGQRQTVLRHLPEHTEQTLGPASSGRAQASSPRLDL